MAEKAGQQSPKTIFLFDAILERYDVAMQQGLPALSGSDGRVELLVPLLSFLSLLLDGF